ncbi:IclR family transcriptional regulator [Nocardioides cavernae]|uniref:IclR family transcriptional regulator n=1 Tax=Nocardioides cavernae TaxID=1921566 RepID=A0ABR8N7Y6_9ACTN|nr:IclR family transcriptional regulator [Nocardioides cavernae]MBD3924260.1 IclR family transcriptional regulator [Nocardioides cavernae]MBM7510801.1 IclR family pca regulon transcriptional regulator [Nocardioides cavernae]
MASLDSPDQEAKAATARTEGGVEIDPRYYVETAAHTITLLKAVAQRGTVTLAGLTSDLGWTKPRVYRLVRTLHACGALRQADDGYSLGPTMISLGYAALQSVRLVEVVRPALQRIHEQTGESVILTVLDGTDIVYMDYLETDHLLVTRARLGSRLPAYLASSGHAILSCLSPDAVTALFAGHVFSPPTARSVSSLDVLQRRLEGVRRRGYALIDQELAPGHRAAAAPVVDHAGHAVAAISISVPTARVTLADLRTMAEKVLLPTAQRVSASLGSQVEV